MFRSRHKEGIKEPDSSERLDGWKEIAAHLRRDVSTVKKWEKQEGLPVHRHVHRSRATVYAYRGELDTWWHNRQDQAEPYHQTAVSPATPGFRRIGIFISGTFLLIVLILMGWNWWRLDQAPALDFHERDWILVTDFENMSDQPLLDGSLEYALERELSASRYVNVIPRPRIEDVLRLMVKPLDTEIDADLGREICLRDGSCRLLVTGRVEKLDGDYVISVQVIEPVQGTSVAALSEEVGGEAGLLPAIRRTSSWLRETLGEALPQIRQSEVDLEEVTTPSLRALQLFTRADGLMRLSTRERSVDRQATAATLLREALSDDPGFAAAYTWLAWTLRNYGRPLEDYLPHAQRGVELSKQASERERYIILASYHRFQGDDEKARPIWESLLERYPGDYWGTNNLAGLYRRVGLRDKEAQLWLKAADHRPYDFQINVRASTRAITRLGDHPRAKRYVLRAKEIASVDKSECLPGDLAWLESFPALVYWVNGNVESLREEANRLEMDLRSHTGRVRDAMARDLGSLYLALGLHRRARELFHEGNREDIDLLLNLYEGSAGSTQQSRSDPAFMEAMTGSAVFQAPFALARAGKLEQAQRLTTALEERRPAWPKEYFRILRAEVARLKGRSDEAIPAFQECLSLPSPGIPGMLFLAAESLAHILEQRGDLDQAAKVLESASERKNRLVTNADLAFWNRNQWLLAKLYRRQGRDDDAVRIESELRHLLRFADPDHPIRLALDSGASG